MGEPLGGKRDDADFFFRYLSTGMNFISLSHDFLIGRSTIAEIIKESCEVIWKVLQALEMPEPNKELWLKVAEEFYKYQIFPASNQL